MSSDEDDDHLLDEDNTTTIVPNASMSLDMFPHRSQIDVEYEAAQCEEPIIAH